MNELAKWVWIVLLGILFMGNWFFILMGINVVIILIVWLIKPEWLKKM